MQTLVSVFRSQHKDPESIGESNNHPESSNISIGQMTVSLSVRNLLTRDINTLDAGQLLEVLPELKSKSIVQEWIPAMERHLIRLHDFTQKYEDERQEESETIRILDIGLNAVLEQTKEIVSRFGDGVAKTQQEADLRKSADLQVLHDTQAQLQKALRAHFDTIRQNYNQLQENNRLKTKLQFLGRYIRNKLSHSLGETSDTSIEEVIKIIDEFHSDPDKEYGVHQTETVPIQEHEHVCMNLDRVRSDLDTVQSLLRESRELARESSLQSDQVLERFGACVEVIKEKDTQIASLEKQLENEQEKSEYYRRKLISSGRATTVVPLPRPFDQSKVEAPSLHSTDTDSHSAGHAKKEGLASKFHRKVVEPSLKKVEGSFSPLDLDMASPAGQRNLKARSSTSASRVVRSSAERSVGLDTRAAAPYFSRPLSAIDEEFLEDEAEDEW